MKEDANDRYIGLDVHATSCTVAIVDARGKRLGHDVLETSGQVLVGWSRSFGRPSPRAAQSPAGYTPRPWSPRRPPPTMIDPGA
jgi:hypothetical protein